MKNLKSVGLGVLAALAFASSAQAVPTEGSQSVYQVTGASDGLSSLKLMINEVSWRGNAIWADSEYSYSDGTVDFTQDDEFSYSFFQDFETTFNDCTNLGHTLESVTVPAGTFMACKMTDSYGDTYWLHPSVPFNYVKAEFEPSSGYGTEELASFSIIP
ncbi:MAG: hypothetical protein JNL01_00340 [Bdellovibrionales bacterium]|nr:hypothetical protein [Bdellovibrionales bacterium]